MLVNKILIKPLQTFILITCCLIAMSLHTKASASQRWDLLTIESIQCVKPAGGVDAWLEEGFGILGSIVSVGSLVVGSEGVGLASAPSIAKAAIEGHSEAKKAVEFLDSKFSGQDDLMVQVNGSKVFPKNKTFQAMNAGQTIYPNIKVSFRNKVRISLIEHDKHDEIGGSDPDDLGNVTIDSSWMKSGQIHRWKKLIVIAPSSEDGSIYYITARVDAGKGNKNTVPQWVKCGTAQCVACPQVQCAERNSYGLDRDGDESDLKSCPPGYKHFKYQKFPQIWPAEDVYLRICKLDSSPGGYWENLGGVIQEQPSCVSWGKNRIDCFARGGGNRMYHKWWNGRKWEGWENLGGTIQGQPSCVSWGPNRIDCFARGGGNRMYHKWWDGRQWGGWEDLSGTIHSQPSCVSWGPNRIDCFARGGGNHMYHKWWNGRKWEGWENLGGVIQGQPSCVSWGPNRIDCFARGGGNRMYHKWWNGRKWDGWENLGGVIQGQPSCVSWGPNRIDCFAKGGGNQMYHKWWNGRKWEGWENLGGRIQSQPSCVSWRPNRIDCFARGDGNYMYHKWWDGRKWGGWEDLGGVIQGQPECVSWGPNRIDCFAKGGGNRLYHKWWDGKKWAN